MVLPNQRLYLLTVSIFSFILEIFHKDSDFFRVQTKISTTLTRFSSIDENYRNARSGSHKVGTGSLNGKQLVVNPQEGTFLFITDWQSFTIPTDVTIVNIENMENFRFIRQQKALFTSTHAPQTSQMLRSGRIYCGGYGPKKTNTHLTEHEKQEKRLST